MNIKQKMAELMGGSEQWEIEWQADGTPLAVKRAGGQYWGERHALIHAAQIMADKEAELARQRAEVYRRIADLDI